MQFNSYLYRHLRQEISRTESALNDFEIVNGFFHLKTFFRIEFQTYWIAEALSREIKRMLQQ